MMFPLEEQRHNPQTVYFCGAGIGSSSTMGQMHVNFRRTLLVDIVCQHPPSSDLPVSPNNIFVQRRRQTQTTGAHLRVTEAPCATPSPVSARGRCVAAAGGVSVAAPAVPPKAERTMN